MSKRKSDVHHIDKEKLDTTDDAIVDDRASEDELAQRRLVKTARGPYATSASFNPFANVNLLSSGSSTTRFSFAPTTANSAAPATKPTSFEVPSTKSTTTMTLAPFDTNKSSISSNSTDKMPSKLQSVLDKYSRARETGQISLQDSFNATALVFQCLQASHKSKSSQSSETPPKVSSPVLTPEKKESQFSTTTLTVSSPEPVQNHTEPSPAVSGSSSYETISQFDNVRLYVHNPPSDSGTKILVGTLALRRFPNGSHVLYMKEEVTLKARFNMTVSEGMSFLVSPYMTKKTKQKRACIKIKGINYVAETEATANMWSLDTTEEVCESIATELEKIQVRRLVG